MIPSVVVGEVRRSVLDYLRTTFRFADADFEDAFFGFLEGERGLFRGPWLDIKLPFRKAQVEDGEDDALELKPPFVPYAHQQLAFMNLSSRVGHQPQHTLVTTGTGSGKTECFLYPILDHCLRERRAGKPGIKAIILYPMNALASDQARRMARELHDNEALKAAGVTAGLYVGGQGRHGKSDRDHLIDDRQVLRKSPPDILLTNYKMLDFLLLRPEDADLWNQNATGTLRYLVLDELHSYDGAQGSDVACLIRRLKARLGVPIEDLHSICCVGTSATIGGEGDDSDQALIRFAKDIFGVPFKPSSLVKEDRETVRESLGRRVEALALPSPATSDLDPAAFTTSETWRTRQEELWFGRRFEDAIQLGKAMESQPFLREILAAIGGRPRSFQEIDAALSETVDGWEERPIEMRAGLLESFVGLVSRARRDRGDGEPVPFLNVQVQLWVRELRSLLQKVGPDFEFSWEEEALGRKDAHFLPIGHCRDCGSNGYAARKHIAKSQILPGRSEIGRSWLEKSPSSVYLLPGRQDGELLDVTLDLSDLSFELRAPVSEGGDDAELRMDVVLENSCRGEGKKERFLFRCPECGGEDALRILGSRAPSLLSVAISEQYLSVYNDDRKLLAFTDSVQDASHRAGFFGARTFRFNLRSAIQKVLEDGADDEFLVGFEDRVIAHLMAQGLEKEKVVAALWPRDLGRIEAYERYIGNPTERNFKYLETRFMRRLSWEVCHEFGHAALLGRSLEKTGCSTLVPDLSAFEAATIDLEAELREEAVFDGVTPSTAELGRFLAMLINRTRQRGGVFHELLEAYVKADGNGYLLSKRKNEWISPFGRNARLPRFLTDRPGHDVFDAFSGKGTTWYADWAARSLGLNVNDPGIRDLYLRSLAILVRVGIMREVETKSKARVWGLQPSALRVTRQVSNLRCKESGRSLLVPTAMLAHFDGAPSPAFRGEGNLVVEDERKDSYYARVYKTGRVERIFVGEHTGLLDREKRERLEERFKAPTRADDENLLVCTPTLEMGIDIGDLSGTILCSVPPAPANYLQRVGRAGRSTGNALVVTMAVTRPHDLYFLEQPEEMLAGSVEPPGCFLEAPEMLKRQLAAFAMDDWARNDVGGAAIPKKVEYVLSERAAKTFPGRFIDHERLHRAAILARFLEIFGKKLDAEDRRYLEEFASSGGIERAVLGAFDAIREELKELKSQTRRLKERLTLLEEGKDEEVAPENREDVLRETFHALRSLRRIAQEMRTKYPLNVLTDAGVLPNYAFPEPGVTLKSVIRKRKDVEEGTNRPNFDYVTVEYQRPASAALQELAPGNTFYAEGHKVRIVDLDVGSQGRPKVEVWRFCDNCHASRLIAKEDKEVDACPRCGSPGWSDEGQLRSMIRFSQSGSYSEELESISVDDDDDRDRLFYETQALIDVDPARHGAGARLVEDLPFGYELLKGLKLTEINLGHRPADAGQGDFEVAGDSRVASAFRVCLDCGRVADPQKHAAGRAVDIQHAVWCRAKKGHQGREELVFLYRSLESQAIRVLLPTAIEDTFETEVNFRAALQLGLRKKFRGNPIHLAIRATTEPYDEDEVARRRFLVIFDTVPGGTGYLAQLWREDGFLEVLELALEAIRGCRCRKILDREGCYHCLYAYQEQEHLHAIKRQTCERLLEDILAARVRMKPVGTLSEARLATRLESELEIRFVRLLRELGTKKEKTLPEVKLEDEIAGEQWRLEVGGVVWRLRTQVNIGSADGVSEATRADFVIDRPDSPEVFPIVVYGDGFAYHAEPEKERARIQDDVLKRAAILESGHFRIWSFSWKDLDAFEEKLESPRLLLGREELKFLRQKFAKAGQVGGWPGERIDALSELLVLLAEQDHDRVAVRVRSGLSLLIRSQGSWPTQTEAQRAEEWIRESDLNGDAPTFEKTSAIPERPCILRLGRFASLIVREVRPRSDQNQVPGLRAILRLDDRQAARQGTDFEHDWRAFLSAINLLQFLDECEFTSLERLQLESGTWASEAVHQPRPLAAAEPTAETAAAELAEVLEMTDAALHPHLEKGLQRGWPIPESSYELSHSGVVIAQADLAWPELRIALFEESNRDIELFAARGWRVLSSQDDPAKLEDFDEAAGTDS